MNQKFLLISTFILAGLVYFFKVRQNNKKFSFKDHVEEINSSNLPWKAEYYENLNLSDGGYKKYLGLKKKFGSNLGLEEVIHSEDIEIPKNFRVSDNWTCKSITDIRDQSDCGSCWAVAAESAMSDRLCIERLKNNQSDNGVYLSSADLNANCSQCGDGCNGGDQNEAFKYLKYNGIVTGGDNGNTTSCYPYPYHKCFHHEKTSKYKNCNTYGYQTLPPTNTCTNEGYNWFSSKYSAKNIYTVKGEENIKRELIKNGSIEACFNVLPGFITYRSGIYNCSKDKGKVEGGHCIRLVGFGEEVAEDGKLTKYWLLTNNWNETWGDKGYIKFDISSDCDLANELVTASGFYKLSDN